MKSCIVVGYGPGLGAAIARAFAREGFQPALIARSAERLAAGERDFDARGVAARGFRADAGDEHALQHALRQAEADCGPCGVLVYNASSTRAEKPLAIRRDALLEDFRVNVAGALTAAQHAAHGMRARGQGTLLFVGAGCALEPDPGHASLSLGKAGLRSLAHTLAAELAPDGVRVAMVTLCGKARPGTAFDPDHIAAACLDLHRQTPGSGPVETTIR